MKRKSIILKIVPLLVVVVFSGIYIWKINKKVDTVEKEKELVTVETSTLDRENFKEERKHIGKLEYKDSEGVIKTSKEEFEKIYVKEGDYVKKGQVLAKFNSDKID